MNKYGKGVSITVSLDGASITGIMYGNDECFDGDEFYQYLVAGNQVFKCYYDTDCDLDCIDYTRPYSVVETDDLEEDLKMEKAVEKIVNSLVLGEAERDDITFNTCRNGRDVAWYLDDSKEMCVYIDTLEVLSQDEIEKELI